MSALPAHTGATPVGYSNFILSNNAVASGQAIRGGSRSNTAASEDPGTYTMSATETWQASRSHAAAPGRLTTDVPERI